MLPSVPHNRFLRSFANTGALVSAVAVAPGLFAQDSCCFEPQYRLECETVMQPETVQRMRLTYDTKMVEEEVTSYRPVLKTRVEEKQYRVARPVTETSFREERYTVYKPVTETSYRDETVTQTRYVTETAEREEQVTTYRPVTETQVYEQRYSVARPVTQTQMRQQQYMVQRPVTETQYQTQQYMSYRPVTSYRQQTVDAGGYVPQTTVTPGNVGYGLAWNPRAYGVPGPFGLFARVRGGAVAVPTATPPQVQTQMVYRPNYIQQQIAQTSYLPEMQQVQRPVQVQRMQSEMVTQNVPVQVQRLQTEIVTQKIPVQRTRMVPQTLVRKVPYVVQRPVTETLTRKVPVQHQRWVAEERVRKVPVQSTRMVYETRREPVTVNYYEQEQVRRKVLRPVTVPRYEPYTVTRMVPRQVVQRLPLSYVDPFSPAIVSGYSSMSTSTPYSASYPSTSYPSSSSIVTEPSEAWSGDSVRSNRAAIDDGESVLEGPAQNDTTRPQSRLGGVDFSQPESSDGSLDDLNTLEKMFEDDPSSEVLPDPSDSDSVDQPELDAREANWRSYSQQRPAFRPISYVSGKSVARTPSAIQWNSAFVRAGRR